MKVVISNGFGQFHMARLAENLELRGVLASFLTGGYPAGRPARLLTLAGSRPSAKRLMERKVEVAESKVHSCWSAEVTHQLTQWARHRGYQRTAEATTSITLNLYSNWAARKLRKQVGQVYHYRAGMGGRSVIRAKKRGMLTVCDHSIVHPRILEGLVNGTNEIAAGQLSALWRRVEQDLNRADRIVVNSEFVAETCVKAGVSASKITVAYTGVDPNFVLNVDNQLVTDRWTVPTVLFAGTLEKRKGTEVLVKAASALNTSNYRWNIVGRWEPDSVHLAAELPDSVVQEGRLGRDELAKRMASSAVFLFPTKAEGSARVVAEALVAGCYVITTSNAGSIVRDGVDGRIIGVGDAEGAIKALHEYESLTWQERKSRSAATRDYARKRLHESVYTEGVRKAYSQVERI
jgi:glycosyltransferase involved in cell wall biosynthesis